MSIGCIYFHTRLLNSLTVGNVNNEQQKVKLTNMNKEIENNQSLYHQHVFWLYILKHK